MPEVWFPSRTLGLSPEELRQFSEYGLVSFREHSMDVYAFATTVYVVRSLSFTG